MTCAYKYNSQEINPSVFHNRMHYTYWKETCVYPIKCLNAIASSRLAVEWRDKPCIWYTKAAYYHTIIWSPYDERIVDYRSNPWLWDVRTYVDDEMPKGTERMVLMYRSASSNVRVKGIGYGIVWFVGCKYPSSSSSIITTMVIMDGWKVNRWTGFDTFFKRGLYSPSFHTSIYPPCLRF